MCYVCMCGMMVKDLVDSGQKALMNGTTARTGDDICPLPALRSLALGGEPIPWSVVRRWTAPGTNPTTLTSRCSCSSLLCYRAGSQLEVWNVYGLTEATVVQSAFRLNHLSSDEMNGSVCRSVGAPLPGIRFGFIQTEASSTKGLSLASNAERAILSGEVCINGVQLGFGYLNDEELTSKRFLIDHELTAVGPDGSAARKIRGNWLRTGDIGIWDGGCLHIRGRIDTQVKFRGRRVDLGEIDAALLSGDGVWYQRLL